MRLYKPQIDPRDPQSIPSQAEDDIVVDRREDDNRYSIN